jgi:hypothetical protein
MQNRFVTADTGPESIIKPTLKQACLPARQVQDDVFSSNVSSGFVARF